MEAALKRVAPNLAADESHPAVNSILGANPFIDLDARQILGTVAALRRHLASHPDVVLSRMGQLGVDLVQVALGTSSVEPDGGDRRFSDPAFSQHPAYRRLMQTYLTWRAAMHDLVEGNGGDWKDNEQLRFAMMLFTEAAAPTNVLPGNPGALKHAFDTAGVSLIRGLRNFLEDLWSNGGMPTQVDSRPFQVGRNLGVTAGSVVYRGPLCEVIQYRPRTEKVFARPLVLIPPQINKFYILDLAPRRSLIEYALDHGVQVFTISWRNPTAEQREMGIDDYVDACKRALTAAREITGSPDANVLGVCAGGITTSLMLGHLAGRRENVVNAVTLLVTMLDTSLPSMTGMFATEDLIKDAIERSKKKGVLSGRDMARVFAWLRPNDLVWNYWVNNYLMGEAPPAFDILFWNADSTNLPARLHAGFLDLFLRNPLTKSGAIRVLDTPVDLRAVKCDTYLLAGQTDHICTWRSCYRAVRMFGGKVEFVLNSSGHVQSIVSPPGNLKSHFYTNPVLAGEADDWLSGAADNRGTWWDHWLKWLSARSGEEKPAPTEVGSSAFAPVGLAPGMYVHERH